MAKTKVKYAIVADTETGGLPNKNKKAFYDIALTEIAFVAIDLLKLEIVDSKSWLVKEYKEGLEYSPYAQEVSGITPELLEEKGEDLKDVHRETRDFVKKYTTGKFKPMIVGHNIYNFDRPFFENMYEFLNDDWSNYISVYEDTQHWAGLKYLESTNYKLGTICKNIGVELTDAHRALADTLSNAQMFIEMVKLLRSEGGSQQTNVSKFRDKFKLDVNFVY